MDGVDNRRDLFFRCGSTAKDAGLAGMSVKNIGFKLTAKFTQAVVGIPIFRGVGIADQAWKDDDFIAAGVSAVHERAFRAKTGAGDEGNFVTATMKAFAGEEGIFLRPADDQTCDDMDNLQNLIHWRHK